jgi:hypothetical protein
VAGSQHLGDVELKPFSVGGSSSASSLFPKGAPSGTSGTSSTGAIQAVNPTTGKTSPSSTSSANQNLASYLQQANTGPLSSQSPVNLGNGQQVYVDADGNLIVGNLATIAPTSGSSGSSSTAGTNAGSLDTLLSGAAAAINQGATAFNQWSSAHPIESAVLSAAASALGLGTVVTGVKVASKVFAWLYGKFGSKPTSSEMATDLQGQLGAANSFSTSTSGGALDGGSINPTVTVGNPVSLSEGVTQD